jgi:hypothetical protein
MRRLLISLITLSAFSIMLPILTIATTGPVSCVSPSGNYCDGATTRGSCMAQQTSASCNGGGYQCKGPATGTLPTYLCETVTDSPSGCNDLVAVPCGDDLQYTCKWGVEDGEIEGTPNHCYVDIQGKPNTVDNACKVFGCTQNQP